MDKKKLFVTGGGTGGHLMPALAIAEILIANNYSPVVYTDNRCKNYIPEKLDFSVQIVDLIRANSFKNLYLFFKTLINSFYVYISAIKNEKPCALISCGGYSSIPLLISAIIMRVPIMIHEQNSIVGRTNYWFSYFSKKLFLSFIHTVNLPLIDGKDIIWTGIPVLKKHKVKLESKTKKSKKYDFYILVTGGSQGASIFDELVPNAIKIVKEKYKNLNFFVAQQSRASDIEYIKNLYKDISIDAEVKNFFQDIESHYKNADILIGRSGASTINEIIEYHLPSILIPFPHAKDNHQAYNAKNLAEFKSAILLHQKDASPESLSKDISKLIDNPSELKELSYNLSRLKIDSSEIILEEIKKVIDK
jgi:UDP-N-acetylglucosamine--N-acetylmuramyl-(pentapeptide) pyrophosphoryl-undecaprenol N-acetylglucosamine transferase